MFCPTSRAVLGEAPGFYDIGSLNTLLSDYGMTFGTADMFENITDMAMHPITSGISWFFYQRGSDVIATGAAQQIAWYDIYGVLAVWDDFSRVVAIGDMGFLGTNTYRAATCSLVLTSSTGLSQLNLMLLGASDWDHTS